MLCSHIQFLLIQSHEKKVCTWSPVPLLVELAFEKVFHYVPRAPLPIPLYSWAMMHEILIVQKPFNIAKR